MIVLIFLLLAIVVEAICEIVTESYFFESFRAFVLKRSFFLGVLCACGYCLSVWIALAFCIFVRLSIFDNAILDFLVSWFFLHRMSNVLHHLINRTRRRDSEEKEDE